MNSSFYYPLSFHKAYNIASDPTLANSTLFAILDRSKHTHGDTPLSHLTYPGAASFTKQLQLVTRQNGSSVYLWNDTYYEDAGAIDPAIGTTGATDQWLRSAGLSGYAGGRENSFGEYSRYVHAVDGYEPVLEVDMVRGVLIPVPNTEVITGPGVGHLDFRGDQLSQVLTCINPLPRLKARCLL